MPDAKVFEASRSWVYHFVRYTVMPEAARSVENMGEEPFLLRDVARPIIEKYVTKDQLAVRVPKAIAVGEDTMASIIAFYVGFLGKSLGFFVPLGKGLFRNKTEKDIPEDDLVDEAIESGDEEASEHEGWIYAFSFPIIVKANGQFPIKVGKTVTDVDQRVATQVKGSASFEQPVILGRWKVNRVAPTELAIHNVLKARGRWRENAPGQEWFDTTLAEIEAVLAFIDVQ
jgi:hypothetical protein